MHRRGFFKTVGVAVAGLIGLAIPHSKPTQPDALKELIGARLRQIAQQEFDGSSWKDIEDA